LEILGPKRIGVEFDFSGSRDVIGHVTIRLAVGHIGGPFGTMPLSVTVSEIFTIIQWRM